jgi:hypothetical protein
MHGCTINALARSSLVNADARDVLSDVNSVLAVITSNGSVSILCVNSLETLKSLEPCQVVSTTIKVEPRLIETVCWNLSNQSEHSFNPDTFDKTTQPEQGVAESDPEAASSETSKKRKRKTDDDGEKPRNSSKGSHKFASKVDTKQKPKKKVSFSKKSK